MSCNGPASSFFSSWHEGPGHPGHVKFDASIFESFQMAIRIRLRESPLLETPICLWLPIGFRDGSNMLRRFLRGMGRKCVIQHQNSKLENSLASAPTSFSIGNARSEFPSSSSSSSSSYSSYSSSSSCFAPSSYVLSPVPWKISLTTGVCARSGIRLCVSGKHAGNPV